MLVLNVVRVILLGLVWRVSCASVGTIQNTDILLGYRRVDPTRAKYYNLYGLKFTGNADGAQLGAGIYMANARDTWQLVLPNEWYCRIWANKKSLALVPKAWIPEKRDDGKEIWWREDRIAKYVKSLKKNWDAKYTLRFSRIDGHPEDETQMLIPPDLLTHPEMGWKVQCQQTKYGIPDVPVMYEDWNVNFLGSKS